MQIAEYLDAPICPVCGRPANQTITQYGVRHDHCGLWSWGGKPLVDEATHNARKVAHAAFDPVWKGGLLSRRDAYRQLAVALGIPVKECHISLMDEERARRVPEVAAVILNAYR